MTPGNGPPPGAGGAPEGRPASAGSSRCHSVVGHSAIDVAVTGGGEVQRDRRFVEGDHAAGGDVEAAAEPSPSLPPAPAKPARARSRRTFVWSRVAEPAAPTNMPPPSPLPPLAPEPPSPPWATLRLSKLLLRVVMDDVSEAPSDGHGDAATDAVAAIGPCAAGTALGQVAQEGGVGDAGGRVILESETPADAIATRIAAAAGAADSRARNPGRVDLGGCPPKSPTDPGVHMTRHPVPHLMNSRPARSVVVTWTWFRSQCTWHVSLQRLMRRHLLPSTGSLGLVPPLQRYYEVLRLPTAHFAALRFLRLAIPSLRPLFVPPGPGRGAVDQSGVGRRYLQPPCSMETTGSPKFPEEPL